LNPAVTYFKCPAGQQIGAFVHAGIEWYADYSRIIVVIGCSDDIPGPGQTGKCILAVGQKQLFVFSSVKRRFFQMNPAQTADKLSQSAETAAGRSNIDCRPQFIVGMRRSAPF